MFDHFGLLEEKKKSKHKQLIENGKVYKDQSLLWYKGWRNDAAHNLETIQSNQLRRASDAVQHQLLEWQCISEKFDMRPYQTDVDENNYCYGSILNEIPVLVFRITYRQNGCNWQEQVNLSLEEYFLKTNKRITAI